MVIPLLAGLALTARFAIPKLITRAAPFFSRALPAFRSILSRGVSRAAPIVGGVGKEFLRRPIRTTGIAAGGIVGAGVLTSRKARKAVAGIPGTLFRKGKTIGGIIEEPSRPGKIREIAGLAAGATLIGGLGLAAARELRKRRRRRKRDDPMDVQIISPSAIAAPPLAATAIETQDIIGEVQPMVVKKPIQRRRAARRVAPIQNIIQNQLSVEIA